MLAVNGGAEEQEENFNDISNGLGTSRLQILAAQFECYLKIIHDPPFTEEGDTTRTHCSFMSIIIVQLIRAVHLGLTYP